MKRRIGTTLSAMILAAHLGSPLAAQIASIEQLTAIAALLGENDVEGLRTFLEANPELLEGDGQLAILLRRFMVASADIGTYLAFDPDLSDALSALAAAGQTPPAPEPEPVDSDPVDPPPVDPGPVEPGPIDPIDPEPVDPGPGDPVPSY